MDSQPQDLAPYSNNFYSKSNETPFLNFVESGGGGGKKMWTPSPTFKATLIQASQPEIPFQVTIFQVIFTKFQVIFRIFQVTLAEISDIMGLHWGVNSTICMKLHHAKVFTGMMQILREKIITGQEVCWRYYLNSICSQGLP